MIGALAHDVSANRKFGREAHRPRKMERKFHVTKDPLVITPANLEEGRHLPEVLLLDGSGRLMQRGNGSLNQVNIRRLT
ncbi:hypothetical protein HFO58_31880 [Rhizobium leguminosarum]|nr:hypothetical protein [Rhizobium leguminosarum]MBY5537693.1 hypothetical protein [Rhizobium leguminosarum]